MLEDFSLGGGPVLGLITHLCGTVREDDMGAFSLPVN